MIELACFIVNLKKKIMESILNINYLLFNCNLNLKYKYTMCIKNRLI